MSRKLHNIHIRMNWARLGKYQKVWAGGVARRTRLQHGGRRAQDVLAELWRRVTMAQRRGQAR